jgi:hypothetical protein
MLGTSWIIKMAASDAKRSLFTLVLQKPNGSQLYVPDIAAVYKKTHCRNVNKISVQNKTVDIRTSDSY